MLARVASHSAYTSTSSAPENFAAFAIASRAASTSGRSSSLSSQSPPLASSMRTPCSSSISVAAAARAPASVPPCAVVPSP